MAKVLLVEDDNNLREIYEARLTAEGYDIVTAQNGEEALSVAKQQKPDLVISDVMMPRISGFEMLDILRNTDELRNTKVIMLTALGQAEDRGRADNLGADKYLVKSQVTLEDIVNAAKALLSDEPGDITTPTEPLTATPVSTPAPNATAAQATVVAPAAIPEPAAIVDVAQVTSVQSVPSEPVVVAVAAPDPVTVPVTEPVAPEVITAPTVVTTPTPIATPVTEPVVNVEPVVQPVSATVTVTDPDPIVPHVSPIAEQLAPADTQPIIAPPLVAEPVVVTETNIVPPTAPQTSTAEPQTLAAEEAAIEAQIASFAASDDATPALSPEQASNDAVLQDALSKLTAPDSAQASSDQTPTEAIVVTEPTPEQPVETAPAPEPAVQPDPSVDTTSQISGRKVIQPISDVEAGTPDLEVLLAKEEAKEATYNETNPQPTVIDTAATSSQKPSVDPNTIAL